MQSFHIQPPARTIFLLLDGFVSHELDKLGFADSLG